MKKKSINESSTISLQAEVETLRKQNLKLQSKVSEQDKEIKLLKKFEAISETKSRLLSNISQEIRTPLSSIIGFAQIIQRDMRFGIIEQIPEYQKLIDNIENSGQYLSEITKSIIDISEIERGELFYSETDINIIKFFKNIFYVNKIEALKKNIDFKYEPISDDFPSFIRSDRTKLEKIINNLIDNAIKFTPTGKKINIHLSMQNRSLLFIISDEGIGVSPEYLKTIFNPFEKLNRNDSHQYDGIGLGLSIAQNMAEVIKGSIEVSSVLGKGSVFSLKIPYIAPQNKKSDDNTQQEELVFSKNNKILVVEDNLITQELITKIFSVFGLNIKIANNGKECLDIIKMIKPDLILMDIYMPIMNGLNATIEIRKMSGLEQIPIVGLSSGATASEEINAERVGMNDYLIKPINLDTLLPILGKYLKMEKSFFNGNSGKKHQKERLLQHTVRLQKDRYLQEKQLEERTNALETAKIKAEAANIVKSEFLANISHELRTPMHQILSYSKFGVDKFETAQREKLSLYFQKIRSAGTILMTLLNNLLDLSKLEAGTTKYVMKPGNIEQLFQTVSKEFTTYFLEKKIKFEIIPGNINSNVDCDALEISQVIRNIISNAIKFTQDEKKISIYFDSGLLQIKKPREAIREVKALIVHTVDQGIGIPDDELDAVFDKFVQSSKTRTGAGGTGLGLSICLEIIRAHHGKIWVKNNQNGGSTFSFMLPYEQSSI